MSFSLHLDIRRKMVEHSNRQQHMIVIVVSSIGLVKIGGRFDSFVPHIFEVFSLYYLSIIQTPEQLKEIKHSPSNKKKLVSTGYLSGLTIHLTQFFRVFFYFFII
jgi:hypothetical protein